MTRVQFGDYQPKHLSYSTVSGYRDCGMRMRLQKIEKKEQRPGLAGIGGNAVHSATEWFDLHGFCGDEDPEVVFRDCWEQEIEKRVEQSPSYRYPDDFIATGRASAEHGGKRGVSWWMEQGPIMVQRWIDWRAQTGWHIWETPTGLPAVEVELNITIGDDIPVLMFIDRIMVTTAGEPVILDIKTGRTPETPEQLGLYRVGVQKIFDIDIRWGYFWDAQKGTHSAPLDLSMYTEAYFADVYEQAVAGINAGCFLAKPANGCRNWCGVAKFCSAVGGNPSLS
ncbi:MAG: RecB family exonuclease [Mycobacteriaceae bacterium]